LQVKSFQHILWIILGFTYVFIQLHGIRKALLFMSINLCIQQLARISLPWWSTPCTIHTFTLCKSQIIWYVFWSQSTSIHVYQINVESQNNVLHIKKGSKESMHYLDPQDNLVAPPPNKLFIHVGYKPCSSSSVLHIKSPFQYSPY
jgi:hypothetical protein